MCDLKAQNCGKRCLKIAYLRVPIPFYRWLTKEPSNRVTLCCLSEALMSRDATGNPGNPFLKVPGLFQLPIPRGIEFASLSLPLFPEVPEIVFCCYNCLDLPWEKFFLVWVIFFPQFLRAGILCWEKVVQVRGRRPRICDLFDTLFLLERTEKTSNKHLEKTLSMIQI